MRSPADTIEALEDGLITLGIIHVDQQLVGACTGSSDLCARRKTVLFSLASTIKVLGNEVGSSLSLADSTALQDGKAALWLILDEYGSVMRATADVARCRSQRASPKEIPPTRLYAVKDQVTPVDAHCLRYLLRWHAAHGIRTGIVRFSTLPEEAKTGLVIVQGKVACIIPALELGGPCQPIVSTNTHDSSRLLGLYEDEVVARASILGNERTLDDISGELGIGDTAFGDEHHLCFVGFTSRRNGRYPVILDSSLLWMRPNSYLTLLTLVDGLIRNEASDGRVPLKDLCHSGSSARITTKHNPAYGPIRYLREDLGTFGSLVKCGGKEARIALNPARITMLRVRCPPSAANTDASFGSRE